MEAGIGGKVRLDGVVIVARTGKRVARVVDDAGHQTILVVFEDFLDGRAEVTEVSGRVTAAGIAFPSEVAGEDLLLEAIGRTRDALKVLKNSDLLGNVSASRTLREESIGCRRPIRGWNIITLTQSAFSSAQEWLMCLRSGFFKGLPNYLEFEDVINIPVVLPLYLVLIGRRSRRGFRRGCGENSKSRVRNLGSSRNLRPRSSGLTDVKWSSGHSWMNRLAWSDTKNAHWIDSPPRSGLVPSARI